MIDFDGWTEYVSASELKGHWRGSPRQTWKRTFDEP
jgi:hypothetical protein